MVTRRKKKTTRKTRRMTKKGDGQWKIPKGFVIISKDSIKMLGKSVKALNDAMLYAAQARVTNDKALRRAKV